MPPTSVDRQKIEKPQQHRDVVDVARDRTAHARILNLQREVTALRRGRTMHLPNRSGRNGLVVEPGESSVPAFAVLATEHASKLFRGHRRGLRPQHRQGLREFRWQDVFALERNELPDLHGCAAQPGKPGREPARIGAGQQRTSKVASFAARESSQPLRRRAYRELSRRKAYARDPAEAGPGNRGGCRFMHR
jgi:hypothetical protein